MPTQIYENWVQKTRECGFTLEQSCGLAMIYGFRLLKQAPSEAPRGLQESLKFVSEEDFLEMDRRAFIASDIDEIIMLLRVAGRLLGVKDLDQLAEPSASSEEPEGESAEEDPTDEQPLDDRLTSRHQFDIWLCQSIGESLRSSIRTPLHAFVLSNTTAKMLVRINEDWINIIVNAILRKLSPLVGVLSAVDGIEEQNGYLGYEPFQIALMGCMEKSEILSHAIWDLQRLLFYSQPEGVPINLDRQFIPTPDFSLFALPVISKYINENKQYSIHLTRLVPQTYLTGTLNSRELIRKFSEEMMTRHEIDTDGEYTDKTLQLVVNAMCFKTLAFLLIRNIACREPNDIELASLDSWGLIWEISAPKNRALRSMATLAFQAMIAWRAGACTALFIEREDGSFHAFYLGDEQFEKMTFQDQESFLLKIARAYNAARLMVAFPSEAFPMKGEPVDEKLKVVLVYLDGDGSSYTDFYRCTTSATEGMMLGGYIGTMGEPQFSAGLLPELHDAIKQPADPGERTRLQRELIAAWGHPEAWRF
jgi:hypothetical protein